MRMAEFRAAQQALRGLALRTPLVPLHVDGGGAVHLKLENLQPGGAFKIYEMVSF